MRDEIVKGILGGLLLVVCFVGVGSFIGFSLSHGPEPREEATTSEEAPAEGADTATTAEGEEAPADGEEATAE